MPQTIARPMNLSIEIPDALGEQLKSVPNQQLFIVNAIRHEFGRDPLDQCTSIQDVANIMTRNARKRGLTENILNQLLNED